jgi:hypothetical protein
MEPEERRRRAAKGARQLALYAEQIKKAELEKKPEIKVEFIHGGKIPPCK